MNDEVLLVFGLGGEDVVGALELPASDYAVVGAGQEHFVFGVLDVQDVQDYGLGWDYEVFLFYYQLAVALFLYGRHLDCEFFGLDR